MRRRYGSLVLLSVVTVVATLYAGWTIFQPAPQLPFRVNWINAHSALIEPIAGLTPTSLRAGDRLELVAQSRAVRIALVTSEQTSLPYSASYPLVIQRGATQVRVSVHTVSGSSGPLSTWANWLSLYSLTLFASIALLALWRGHDRAAMWMALWAMAANPLAFAIGSLIPANNGAALFALLGYYGLSLLGRIGFYAMAESIAGIAHNRKKRALWRGLFALLIGAATIVLLGSPIVVVTLGWAGLVHPLLGLLLPASYLVPIALIVASHRHADAQQRLRLRWLLWGSVFLVVGLSPNDLALPLGFVLSTVLNNGFTTLAAAAMLYAVLRHRVVDVTVALNRALVYAATTSLVLGLFALFESLIERSTLGHGAGLALELAVPLGLGAALSSVHRRIEATVERLIFRHQYRMETALRRFAEDCAFITQPENLFELGVEQIARHTNAPVVALYERAAEGYVCVHQRGKRALPEKVAVDDLAFIGLRARNMDFDLNGSQSALGSDGHAFPLMLRGNLLGALVVAERPSEHFAADERALLFHVAHEMGMALFALRVQESETRAQRIQSQLEASESLARTREAALLSALNALRP